MSPRSRFAVLALAALCVAAPPAEAAKHHKKRSACQRLKAKHDLAPAKKVKLVSRHGELRGCVLPRGKVRHIAFREHTDTSSDDYSVRQVKGAIVLLDWSSSSQYGSRDGTTVYDIRTADAYTVASSCSPILTGYCPTPSPQTRAASAFVNSKGQAAAALASGSSVSITGFSSTGTPTEFDSGPSSDIPASSLGLSGRKVTWTHSGQPKSAQLSG